MVERIKYMTKNSKRSEPEVVAEPEVVEPVETGETAPEPQEPVSTERLAISLTVDEFIKIIQAMKG